MGWCHVGPDNGAKAVADLLMFNSTLAVLDLRGNGLGNAGAVHLARALKEHTNDKLTELDLGYNEIKDEGACTLAQVPPTSTAQGQLSALLYDRVGGHTGLFGLFSALMLGKVDAEASLSLTCGSSCVPSCFVIMAVYREAYLKEVAVADFVVDITFADWGRVFFGGV